MCLYCITPMLCMCVRKAIGKRACVCVVVSAQVVFVGIRGENVFSDIAVDYVIIRPQSCDYSPPCTCSLSLPVSLKYRILKVGPTEIT